MTAAAMMPETSAMVSISTAQTSPVEELATSERKRTSYQELEVVLVLF
jgi:hypothetical protein